MKSLIVIALLFLLLGCAAERQVMHHEVFAPDIAMPSVQISMDFCESGGWNIEWNPSNHTLTCWSS